MSAIGVFRIQDAEGRGPYRPGFSHHWVDADHHSRNPAIFEDFPNLQAKMIERAHYGCAFRSTDQARQWFSPREADVLAGLGYQLVRLDVDRIVAESPRQLVFARYRPLRQRVTAVPWAVLAEAA